MYFSSGSSVVHLLIVSSTLLISYGVYRIIYNLYFHPLAGFPGPKLAAISNIYYVKYWLGGRWPFHLEHLHEIYGDVVRYAPNDLDFATPQSWQDVHSSNRQGRKTFLKGDFYPGAKDQTSMSILSTRDPAKHRELRKSLSNAFSVKALRLQTDVVIQYVDLFVTQIKRLGNTKDGIKAEYWYNWLTFDIIGDLAFGESFGAIESANEHPWVTNLKTSMFALAFPDVFRRLPILKLWPSLVRPEGLMAKRQKHMEYSRMKIQRRLAMDNNREDFFSHLLSEKGTSLDPRFLAAQAQTLVIAGSETTATFLIGTTYWLLKNPVVMQRLKDEIRTAFSDPADINDLSTSSLPYLFAVIEEGLRFYPPVPSELHRTVRINLFNSLFSPYIPNMIMGRSISVWSPKSPGATVDGHYVPAGTTVSTNFWTSARRPKYWHQSHEFHPERWLPHEHPLYDQAYDKDVKAASNPFILGPRMCLGVNLAYMEMRIILARLMWEFDLVYGKGAEEVDWDEGNELKILWRKPEFLVRFVPVER